MGLVILILCQVTKTTSQLVSRSPNFHSMSITSEAQFHLTCMGRGNLMVTVANSWPVFAEIPSPGATEDLPCRGADAC
ncbi:hypothetical protein TNCV_2988491 [Trichonephila clavipes]|nr:hypothetical protein TNCV_2988491 [Trichonephila clavipes]